MIVSLQVINKQSRRPSYTVEPRYNEGPGVAASFLLPL